MSSSDKNSTPSEDRDESMLERENADRGGAGAFTEKRAQGAFEAADKAYDLFDPVQDDDFIPKFSQVRSRHDQGAEQNPPPPAQTASNQQVSQQHLPQQSVPQNPQQVSQQHSAQQVSQEQVPPQQVLPQHLPQQAPQPVSEEKQAGPPDEVDDQKVVAQLSAAALAIEMLIVRTFDDIPVTEVQTRPQSFPEKAPWSEGAHPNESIKYAPPAPTAQPAENLNLQEFGFHRNIQEQQGVVQVPVIPNTEPEPPAQRDFVDSLISQSQGLDEIWEKPEPPAQPNYAQQRESQQHIAQVQPAPNVVSQLSRKERSAIIRSSLYWVVQEARLVTHGVFCNYEFPKEPQEEITYNAPQQVGPNVGQPVGQAPADVRQVGDPALQQPVQEQDRQQQPLPAEPVCKSPEAQSAAPQGQGPRLIGPDTHVDKEIDETPTALVAGNATGGGANPEVFERLKPDVIPDARGVIKPDIAISYPPVGGGQLEPVAEEPVDVRPRKSRSEVSEPVSTPKSEDDVDTKDDGIIDLPILGRTYKNVFKKRLITIGSVLVLSIACTLVMYESINSGRDSSKPTASLQKPDKEPEEETSSIKGKREKEPKGKDGLKTAFKLEQEKNYIGALDQFDTIIGADPKNTKALHGRGRVLTKLQRYERAQEDLEAASNQEPGNDLIMLDLAAVKYLLTDYSGAAREYERIISAHPNDVDALYGRGISYAAMGQNEEAISDFENVVKFKPAYDKAYRQMCTTYLAMNQPDKAEAAITVAMKACGTDADLFFSRGLSRYQMNRKEEALKDYDEAVKLNPKRKEYYNDRGYVLMELKRFDAAKKDFRKALELDPTYKLAVDNLSRLDKLRRK